MGKGGCSIPEFFSIVFLFGIFYSFEFQVMYVLFIGIDEVRNILTNVVLPSIVLTLCG
jgi:hypothetical protein